MLGCLALAIDQTGAYIHMQRVTFRKYQELFHERRADMLSDDRFKGADARSRAVYGTFDLSYQAIKDLADDNKDNDDGLVAIDALTFLELISFYHNERVPLLMFARFAGMAGYWKEAGRGFHPLVNGRVCFTRLLSAVLDASNEKVEWKSRGHAFRYISLGKAFTHYVPNPGCGGLDACPHQFMG
jgi:hypothetical protein